jgi:hypothetical protein
MSFLCATTAAVLALASVAGVGPAGAEMHSQTAPKVLKIASVSFAQNYGDLVKGAQARFDEANKNKELPGGRTVDYIGLIDDKSTADGTVAAVRQAKEQQGAWAIVGSGSQYITPDYVNQQKLPWVGWGINDAFCTHGANTPWYLIAITGCLNPANPPYGNSAWPAAVAKQIDGAKGNTVGCIAEDNDTGKRGVATVCNGAKAVGFKVLFADASIPAQPFVVSDWAPYVQKILTANDGKPVDVMLVLPTLPNVIGLTTALRQAGYAGLNSNGGYAPALVAPLNSAVAYTQWATPESAAQVNNTEMTKILASLNKGGTTLDKVTQVALIGWYSADMFIKITKKVGKNLTPEAWAKVAKSFTYELPDTIGPTTYPQAFAAPTPCSQLATSNGTAWNVSQPYGCYDSIDNATGKLIPYDKVKATTKY